MFQFYQAEKYVFRVVDFAIFSELIIKCTLLLSV